MYKKWFFVFITPSVVGVAVFVLLPFADVVKRSFMTVMSQEFTGLDNYRRVFDNQAFANHRAMAAKIGKILKLPPLKQAMASKQFKSIYLDKLLSMQKKK